MYSIAVLTFAPKHYTSNDINEMRWILAWQRYYGQKHNTFTETIITTVYFMTAIKMNGTV